MFRGFKNVFKDSYLDEQCFLNNGSPSLSSWLLAFTSLLALGHIHALSAQHHPSAERHRLAACPRRRGGGVRQVGTAD